MDRRGFTLVELTIVVAIIALIAAIGTPNILRARKKANETVCRANRTQLERAEQLFVANNQRHSVSITELVESGELISAKCPNNGTFFWMEFEPDSPFYMTLMACSIHGLYSTSEANDEIFEKILLSDDFSGNLSQWQTLLGQWKIENGMLVSQAGRYSMIVTGEKTLGNSVISVTATVPDKRGSAAIVFHTESRNGRLYNGYALEADRGRGKFIFTIVSRGRYNERDFAKIPKNFDWTVPHELEVVVNNDRFSLLIDGTEVMQTSDSRYTSGQVGLYADRKDLTFDNFEVRESK